MPTAAPVPTRAASIQRRRMLFALFFALALLAFGGEAAETTLRGAWRPARAQESAVAVTLADPGMRVFDPARPQTFTPGEAASWILLWPARGEWPATPFVVEVDAPGLQAAHFFPPYSGAVQSARLMSTANALAGIDRVAFRVARTPAAGEPLRLLLDARGVVPSPVTFAARPLDDYLRADTRWVAFASVCLAMMLTVLLVAVFFCLRLGDPAFAYYAVFNLAYAMILALQSGYVVEPLGWSFVAAAPQAWGRVATVLCVVFAILFMSRFADLRHYAPRWRTFLLGYAGVIGMLTAYGMLPVPGAHGFVQGIINPLLALGMLAALGAGVLAALRGSRYALFFLAGWAPLLLVNALGSVQPYGLAPDWVLGDAAGLGVGAFEALVLAFGLVHRSAVMRREHTQARRLADIDPLTGVFNRRAWGRRLVELEERMRLRGESLSLLFLDVDRFKQINDRLGHDAGDRALQAIAAVMRQELRNLDEIGRYGGEEFVVALPGADAQRAMQIAERIRIHMQLLASASVEGGMPTVSIGVASTRGKLDPETLVRCADRAMYAAKKSGRNKVVLDAEPGNPAANDSTATHVLGSEPA